MQVEVPPWVSQWLSAAEWRRRQRERDRRLPGLTLYYGPYRDPAAGQPVFRIGGFPEREGVLGRAGGAAPPPGGWVPLHYPLDPFLAHHPADLAHMPLNIQGTRPRVNVEWIPPVGAVGATGAEGAGGGAGGAGRAALRAWVFGSALVVLVLVLVRAIDKCLTLNLLKSRRRSQEWPRANVRATSRQETDISTVMIPDADEQTNYSEVLSVDLPPPYSECAGAGGGAGSGAGAGAGAGGTGAYKLPDYEEPPPYSDTYVEFSNKNGVPSVLIYSRRRTPLLNRRHPTPAAGDELTDDQDEHTELVDDLESIPSGSGPSSDTVLPEVHSQSNNKDDTNPKDNSPACSSRTDVEENGAKDGEIIV